MPDLPSSQTPLPSRCEVCLPHPHRVAPMRCPHPIVSPVLLLEAQGRPRSAACPHPRGPRQSPSPAGHMLGGSFYKENKCLYFPRKKQEVGTDGRDRRYPMSSKCFPSGNILEVSSALFSSCPGQFCKAVPIFREGKTRPGRSRDKSGLGPGLLVNSRAPSPLCTQ